MIILNKNEIMKLSTVIFALLFFAFQMAFAQEFDCDISVNTQNLSNESRDNLSDFAQQVKQYINNYKWTDQNFGNDKIKCALQINFQSSQGANHYSTQVLIISQRPIHKSNQNTAVLRLKDDNWEFDYVRLQPFNHDNLRFDPLLSFLDYYCYIILGYDFDTFGTLEGTPYFEKAMDIVSKAGGSPTAGKGWELAQQSTYTRGQFVDELLNAKFRILREANHKYHYKGLDLLYKNSDQAKKNILSALESIGKLQEKINQRSFVIKSFFDAKFQEIADTFRGYSDTDVFKKIIKIDQSHQQTYEKAQKGQ